MQAQQLVATPAAIQDAAAAAEGVAAASAAVAPTAAPTETVAATATGIAPVPVVAATAEAQATTDANTAAAGCAAATQPQEGGSARKQNKDLPQAGLRQKDVQLRDNQVRRKAFWAKLGIASEGQYRAKGRSEDVNARIESPCGSLRIPV